MLPIITHIIIRFRFDSIFFTLHLNRTHTSPVLRTAPSENLYKNIFLWRVPFSTCMWNLFFTFQRLLMHTHTHSSTGFEHSFVAYFLLKHFCLGQKFSAYDFPSASNSIFEMSCGNKMYHGKRNTTSSAAVVAVAYTTYYTEGDTSLNDTSPQNK